MSASPKYLIGETRELRHTRFGCALVKIHSVDEEWADVEIVRGKLVGMRDEWAVGEMKTVRLSHCHFYPKTEAST